MSAANDQSTFDTDRPIVALDFDGVLCNSVGESSSTAYRCIRAHYPEVLANTEWETLPDGRPPDWLMFKMRQLRPVVETGYENILLARLMLEDYKTSGGPQLEGRSDKPRPLTMGEIAENWNSHLKETLTHRYGKSKDELVHEFGDMRDRWMSEDPEGWLKANSFFETRGVLEAVKESSANVYIITTKQHRFADALIKHAGLKIPDGQLYGLGTGPKADILAKLLDEHPDSAVHFVEDRVETLEGIAACPRLDRVQLYLASWGYNTPEQRKRGAEHPRIAVITAEQFRDILHPKAVQVQ